MAGVLSKNCWECESQEQPIGMRSGPCWNLSGKENSEEFDNDEVPEPCDNGYLGCGISIAVKGNVEDIQRYCIEDRDSWYDPGCQDMTIVSKLHFIHHNVAYIASERQNLCSRMSN